MNPHKITLLEDILFVGNLPLIGCLHLVVSLAQTVPKNSPLAQPPEEKQAQQINLILLSSLKTSPLAVRTNRPLFEHQLKRSETMGHQSDDPQPPYDISQHVIPIH